MSFKDLTDSRSLSACIRYLPYAETLGARCFGARLSGLHVVPSEMSPYFKPGAVERIATLFLESAREGTVQDEAKKSS